MTVASHLFRNTRLVLGLTFALGAAACAQQTAPRASAPSSADLSLQPTGQSTAMPATGMQGMDHSRMPGMSGSNMQGHNMSGMNMQQMMAHCAEMRQQMRPGATMSPDMQAMMAHCNQMHPQAGTAGSAAAAGRYRP